MTEPKLVKRKPAENYGFTSYDVLVDGTVIGQVHSMGEIRSNRDALTMGTVLWYTSLDSWNRYDTRKEAVATLITLARPFG